MNAIRTVGKNNLYFARNAELNLRGSDALLLSAICQFWEQLFNKYIFWQKIRCQGANELPRQLKDWAEVWLFFPIGDLNFFVFFGSLLTKSICVHSKKLKNVLKMLWLILRKSFTTIQHLALCRYDSTRRGRGVSWGRGDRVLEHAGQRVNVMTHYRAELRI